MAPLGGFRSSCVGPIRVANGDLLASPAELERGRLGLASRGFADRGRRDHQLDVALEDGQLDGRAGRPLRGDPEAQRGLGRGAAGDPIALDREAVDRLGGLVPGRVERPVARQLGGLGGRDEAERRGRELDGVAWLLSAADRDRIGLLVERPVGDQAGPILLREDLADAPRAGDREELGGRGGRGRRRARGGAAGGDGAAEGAAWVAAVDGAAGTAV